MRRRGAEVTMVDCTLREMLVMGFRSICSQEVAFDNPTFVVGPNGSGKSNFADAFAFLAEAMVSPLQAVIERRGGFAAVSHRSSSRGRPSNLTLRVQLEKPDSDTTEASYYIDLRPRRGNDFEVAEEMCAVARSDGSHGFRRRTVKGTTQWDLSVDSLAPAVEPNALALPLVGGDKRFQPVLRFLSGMRTYRIEPTELRISRSTLAALLPSGRNTVPPSGSCIARPRALHVTSSWRTGSTKPGFWPQSNRCAAIAVSGTTAEPHPDPERSRGAKEQLDARMEPGATYLEITDQPAFSALFSLPAAYRRSRSFRKFADSFRNLARAMGHDVGVWPPAAWTGVA